MARGEKEKESLLLENCTEKFKERKYNKMPFKNSRIYHQISTDS
jgi:hypothetical protein